MTTKACVRFSSIFLVAILAVACGDAERGVRAINLQSGQQQEFGSEGEVPPGWGVCPDNDCSILPGVPCQNLGELMCRATPGCELVELVCSAMACAAPVDGEPLDPNCNQPPVCEYACVPEGKKTCEQITDENECLGKDECAWDRVDCAMVCNEDGDCPPCPSVGICRTKTPEQCEGLGATQCDKRPDCEWAPQPCPAIACAPDQPDCAVDCPAFCRAKKPDNCVAIGMPVPVCENGHVITRYDDAGCVIGYECVEDCPIYDMAFPDCGGVPPLPTLDERGCVVGYTCPNVCPPTPLAMPFCENGTPLPKYDENGCITGYTCETCPAIPMIYPDCGDNGQAVPSYDDNGCLKGYICQTACPAIGFVEPDCADGQKAVPTYDSAGCQTGYRCVAL